MKYYFIFILFAFTCETHSQVFFKEENSRLYKYLDKMWVKGVGNINTSIQPISVDYIRAETLKFHKSKMGLFSNTQHDLRTFTLFFDSMPSKKAEFFHNTGRDNFNLFYYSDSTFKVILNPLLFYSISAANEQSWSHIQNGLSVSGSVNEKVYFNLKVCNYLISGENIKQRRTITPEHGYNPLKIMENSVEFDLVDVALGYSWNWGNITVGKINPIWGSGERSQIIFSDKAPSFPLIQLDIKPVDWFSFRYFHGWLHSNLIDSNSVRYTLVMGRNSFQQIPKYIAAHILSILPFQNMIVNIGESVVYSENVELLYLIPIMLFRTAESYLQDNVSNTGNNGQMFADFVYSVPSWGTKIYSTLFIDDLSPAYLSKGNNATNIYAYTIGLKRIDLFSSNNSITAEYTRSNPFVYMNSNGADLYTNHGYFLGNWLGSNADVLYIKYFQEITPELDFSIWSEYIRKGAKESPEQQYQLPYPEFLFGEVSVLHNLGFNICYTLWGKIKFQAEYLHRFKNSNRFISEYYLQEKNLFTTTLSYGF